VRFSVITPSYNQLDWLRLCVASVRDQVCTNAEPKSEPMMMQPSATHPPLKARHMDFCSRQPTTNSERRIMNVSTLRVEHIIQDAGSPGIEEFARETGADFYRDGVRVFPSTEDRRSEIEDRGQRLPTESPFSISQLPSPYRITVHCDPDGGMYDAINRGLRKSSGEICAWLNCDEQYLPSALSIVKQAAASNPSAELFSGDMLLVDKKHNLLAYRKAFKPYPLHLRMHQLTAPSCALFFRRSILNRGLYLDSTRRVIGDAVWMGRVLENRCQFQMLNRPLAAFALSDENLSHDASACRELTEWRKTAPFLYKMLAQVDALFFIVKKLVYGAYVRRDIECALYGFSSPQRRILRRNRKLPSCWPKITSP
jgi:glycosyltransferase involved in cell wall biosynthesis